MPSRGSPNSARRSSRTNAALHPPRRRSLPLHLPPHGHHFIKRLRRDPAPSPDVRTADAQTPLWPSVNLYTPSAGQWLACVSKSAGWILMHSQATALPRRGFIKARGVMTAMCGEDDAARHGGAGSMERRELGVVSRSSRAPPDGGEGGSRKEAAGRWGVCKATTGASPRNPQLAHSSLVSNFNPLQTGKSLQRDP